MSQRKPTPSQVEAYAREFVLNGKKAPAFRVAFPDTKASQGNTHRLASNFSKLIEVRARAESLQAEAKKERAKKDEPFHLSFEQKQKMLAGIYADAKKAGKHTAAVAALKELNLMDGAHAETRSRLSIGGADGAPPVKLTLNDFYNDAEAEAAKGAK